jgi:hypothetical protein
MMMKTKRKKTPVTPHNQATRTLATAAVERLESLEQTIRQRAYELYDARGREQGHHIEDWLQAEAEVTETRARTTAA